MASDGHKKAEREIFEARGNGTKNLNFSRYRLLELPESLFQLTQLRELDLSGNQLTELPASLVKLTQLRELNLSSNYLTELPALLFELKQLEELNLSNSGLTELPASLGELKQLQRLNFSVNRLTELPASLGELKRLEELNLSINSLTELPASLGELKQLLRLNLSANHLTELPASLGELKQLEELNLSNNRLTALPASFGELKQLLRLNLSVNRIAELPTTLGQLTQLQELYLHLNKTLSIPIEILGPRSYEVMMSSAPPVKPAEILDYYFSTRGDQGSALREVKLIVVGRGGVGKTSLIKRLHECPLDLKESETHGINISDLELTCNDGPVTAHVWDFGGQHVLHAMHEFFLTARSLYLLVLGEREDMAERDAAYWLQLIRSYAGKAPVVVALNKNQGRAREMDRESLEQIYGPILAWVPTECSEGYDHTINNLSEALTQAVDGMHEVCDLFPRKWWEVKEWLEDMSEPFIDFQSYQAKCHTLKVEDELEQEKLAARLNDLGIAINYVEDDRLHDTTVLRPDWLANGIYAILRANDSNHPEPLAPEATITAKSLGPIYQASERLKMLKATDYPEQKWAFLLLLMKQFQLAFPVDETGQTLLIPTLLPLEPPKGCEEPEDENRTRLRYEFDVVPGPLLPKFLVRTFSLIKGERRWRRGAILQFGSALARVWTTQDERWVHITAVGDAEDREELLTMIRVTLAELFAEYKDLRAEEHWEYKGKWVPRETLEDFGVLEAEEARREVF